MRVGVFAIGLLAVSCSKSSEVTCGPGTTLKDGACVIEPKAAEPKAAEPKAAEPKAAEPKAAEPTPAEAKVPEEKPADVKAIDPWNVPSEAPTIEWVYQSKHDDMRNKDLYAAQLRSTNSVDFAFPYHGGSHLDLILRTGEPGAGVDLGVLADISKGQFECGYSGCSVSVKFDDGKVQRWSVDTGSGGRDRLFFSRPSQFISSLKKAKKLIIEASFYSEGRRQFTFDVPPLQWPPPGSKPGTK